MIYLCFEGDKRGFEGEIFELELNFELSTFERWLLRSCNIDFPKSIIFDNNIESSWYNKTSYNFSSSSLSFLSLWSDIYEWLAN